MLRSQFVPRKEGRQIQRASRAQQTDKRRMKSQIGLSLTVLAVLAAIWVLSVAPDNGFAKPPKGKGGGGGGGLSGLNVMILDGHRISSDNDDVFGNIYLDGVEHVEAITGAGFRFDTDGGSKIINKSQVRFVNFDFSGTSGFDLVLGPNFPAGATPGVDARIGDETDVFGLSLGTGRLNLGGMAANTTGYADFFINFGFNNSDGVAEKWQLTFGPPPGGDGDLPVDYGSRVTVDAGDDTNNDGFADSWTITGSDAGLRLLKVGSDSTDIYLGSGSMPFVFDVVRQ